jgi:hypothetical protein
LRRAPTLPRTWSAQRFASSFCWISLYAASACLTAAVAVLAAVASRPPHHPPPPPPPPCSGVLSAREGSASPSPSELGVSPALVLELLSALRRERSSLLRTDVEAPRAGLGECGRLPLVASAAAGPLALARLSSFSSSASASIPAAGAAAEEAGLAARAAWPLMPSSWASSSSSERGFFWAMMGLWGEWRSDGKCGEVIAWSNAGWS